MFIGLFYNDENGTHRSIYLNMSFSLKTYWGDLACFVVLFLFLPEELYHPYKANWFYEINVELTAEHFGVESNFLLIKNCILYQKSLRQVQHCFTTLLLQVGKFGPDQGLSPLMKSSISM